MIKPKSREDKTTQAAALFLKLAGGEMAYLKLLKLLYILDRKALFTWGRPVSYDSYVSMDNGPVLSKTYDLITEETEPGKDSYWKKYIAEPKHYSVELLKDKDCPDDSLSEAEIELIKHVFSEFGSMDKWILVELTHKFEEWQDPHGTAIPIQYYKILKAGNKTDTEIKAIESEIESLSFLDRYL